MEMIVALVIIALLSGAIYTTFSQGLRLWSRGSKDRSEWKTHLFIEKFTVELRNAFLDPKWNLQGNKNSLALATLTSDGVHDYHPTYVRYRYDPRSKRLESQRNSFEDVFMDHPVQKPFRTIFEKVQAFELEYYAYDPRAKGYRWYSAWNGNCFPQTVKVTIESAGGAGQKMITMIDFPVGVPCPS